LAFEEGNATFASKDGVTRQAISQRVSATYKKLRGHKVVRELASDMGFDMNKPDEDHKRQEPAAA